jgi:hypothetical protein
VLISKRCFVDRADYKEQTMTLRGKITQIDVCTPECDIFHCFVTLEGANAEEEFNNIVQHPMVQADLEGEQKIHNLHELAEYEFRSPRTLDTPLERIISSEGYAEIQTKDINEGDQLYPLVQKILEILKIQGKAISISFCPEGNPKEVTTSEDGCPLSFSLES